MAWWCSVGWIGDEAKNSDQRVPWLGDIPGIGRVALCSNASQRTKQNLMVFIRPRIMRDGETLAQLSSEKYRNLKVNSNLALPAISDNNALLRLFPASRERLDEGVVSTLLPIDWRARRAWRGRRARRVDLVPARGCRHRRLAGPDWLFSKPLKFVPMMLNICSM